MRLIDAKNPANRLYVSDFVIEQMQKIPTIEAEPVRHRRWKQARYTAAPLYICSECDKPTYKQHNYCPHCGAKMDGNPKEE